MEAAMALPKLQLGVVLGGGGGVGGGASSQQPRFLAPIEPPTLPFPLPPWGLGRKPRAIVLLDVYKNHELLTTYTVDQKALYLLGRNAVVCDIVLNHCSVSRMHAALIHHRDGATYVVDLGSYHGTFVDDVQLRALQPTLLLHGAVLKFGASSRSYAFKAFESEEQIAEMVDARIGLEPDEREVQHNTLLNRGLSYRLGLSIPAAYKRTDAEGDERMPMARQMEEPTSAAALIRRTQSEDNSLAGAFPLVPPPLLHIATSALAAPLPPPTTTTTITMTTMPLPGRDEPGRKRSRTQSAGIPAPSPSMVPASSTTNSPLPPGAGQHAPTSDGGAHSGGGSGDSASAAALAVMVPRRVHFSERPPETIPERAYAIDGEGEHTAAGDECGGSGFALSIATPTSIGPGNGAETRRILDDHCGVSLSFSLAAIDAGDDEDKATGGPTAAPRDEHDGDGNGAVLARRHRPA